MASARSPRRSRGPEARRDGPAGFRAFVAEVGRTLREAGFTDARLRERLGVGSADDVGLLNRAPLLARLHGDRSRPATFARLFVLEDEVSARVARRAFGPSLFDACVRWRLLRATPGGVSATVRIDAAGGLLLCSDRRLTSPVGRALGLTGRDPVYPPGADSLLLRDVVEAPPGATVLDLCTGSGIQALARAEAGRLVAVDINPRAVAMVGVNAVLNGVAHVEARRGDLYAPVRGERFDVVIANPPFVTSPYAAAGPSYHAGGPAGDRVLRRILAGLDGHLNPGGRAFAVTHFAARRGTTVAEAARRWFAGFGGRALVVTVETGTAVDLAAAQALFALRRGLGAYAAEVRRWLAFLRRHRIAEIAVLLVCAERGGRAAIDVVDGRARVLPLPLAPPPPARIRAWLAGEAGTGTGAPAVRTLHEGRAASIVSAPPEGGPP